MRGRGRGRGRGRRHSPARRDRSGSSSGSASPTGDPALDAQDALRRRLERAKKKQQEKAEREKAEMEAKLESGEAAAGAPPSIAGVNPLLAGQQVTPQEAVCAAARAMQMKVAAETGIQVPSYYNPTAVNPMKYAEQMQKRKLLWAGKKEKKEGDAPAGTVWDKTKFHDEATQAKFRRLMGIHGEASGSGESHAPVEGPDIQQEQEKLFRSLEAQYELARGTTHTQKGVGLGFSSARQPGPTL
ncbi:RSRC2 [Branchiostoma lanceolatum]|uniref:Arginine/serine-rich coiled-coil protein 2 n=1 Tax=Branchiostoma lanceolatum TaxID=7740 RepID=A0A8J9YQS7_BRALA|nr:RSRC2 [Branchiostoma lanceolatum]